MDIWLFVYCFCSENSSQVECIHCHKLIYPGEEVCCSIRGCQGVYHKTCANESLRMSNPKKFQCPQHVILASANLLFTFKDFYILVSLLLPSKNVFGHLQSREGKKGEGQIFIYIYIYIYIYIVFLPEQEVLVQPWFFFPFWLLTFYLCVYFLYNCFLSISVMLLSLIDKNLPGLFSVFLIISMVLWMPYCKHNLVTTQMLHVFLVFCFWD